MIDYLISASWYVFISFIVLWALYPFFRWIDKIHMKGLGHPDYQDKEEVDKKEEVVKKPLNEKKSSDYRNVD